MTYKNLKPEHNKGKIAPKSGVEYQKSLNPVI